MAFTSAQQVQIDRISSSRQADMVMAKLEKYSVLQLRARANVIGVSAGGVVTYDAVNDYTTAERQAIADELLPSDKWLLRIPEIVAAGLSLQQRVTALEA
jgi:hypothetical protein